MRDTKRNATYWGKAGAGILLLSGSRVLLTLRSEEVLEPGTWGIPGGKVEPGEQAYMAALREAQEELGPVPPHVVFGEVVFQDGKFRYTTFLARIEPEFAESWEPRLNWENDEAAWFEVDDLPDDLHFGVEFVQRERSDLFGRHMAMNMDEGLRGLERQASGGDPAVRRRLLRQRFRAGVGPGPAVAETIERLVASANASADDGSGVTVPEVAQIVKAVLAPPSERRELHRHRERWQTRTLVDELAHGDELVRGEFVRTHDPIWRGTAFAWATGERGQNDPETVAPRRVTHALAVLRPDGRVTIAVAPTSLTDVHGDERHRLYHPGLDPTDAWPDVLPQGYIGFGFMDAPVWLHDAKNFPRGGYVGGEGPRPFFDATAWHSYQMFELEDGLYRWADIAAPDRVTVTTDEAEAFAHGVDASDPLWW